MLNRTFNQNRGTTMMRYGSMVLLLVALVFLALKSPAHAINELCLVADPEDPSLNVRDAPNGKVINRLRNGRAVFIMEKKPDSRSRPWANVMGYYKGEFREWGWVFHRNLDCFGAWNPAATTTADYPIVFTRAADLKPTGIALEGYGPDGFQIKQYENRCYYYGDGGNSLSVTADLLRYYEKNGFSLNSLCMALTSGILFDPESGRRLPSYVVVDEKVLRQQGFADAGVLSPELPLDVPKCFRRGVPLSDCVFNYNPVSGKKLSGRARDWFAQMGEKVLEIMTAELRSGTFARPCACEERNQIPRSCHTEKNGACEGERYIVGNLAIERRRLPGVPYEASIGFYDFSPALPLGFGYALFADGAAGPSGEIGSEELILAGKNRATKAGIQAVLNARSGN